MARLFASAGDEVNFGTGISKLTVTEYTILGWGFRTGTMTDGRITNRASGTGSGHMQFSESSTNRLRLRQSFTTTTAIAESEIDFIILNEWAFYVTLLDASNVPRLFRSKPDESVMVEATYVQQVTGAGTLAAKESEEFLIGEASSGTRGWLGRLANISIYNRELTQNEMLAVKNGVLLTGLLLHAPLWGVASPEPDLSPNPETGVVTGATQVDGPPVGFYAPFPGGYESAAVAAAVAVNELDFQRGSRRGILRGVLRGA